MAKKEAKKAAIAAKKAELAVAKNANTIIAKLKKVKATEKLAIKKKVLKAEANMKKVNDQIAKKF